MIKDVKNGQCHRADKLVGEALSKILTKKKNLKPEEKEEIEQTIRDCEEYTKEQIDEVINKYKIKAPDTGNDLSEAVPFNLMFATEIGPTGHLSGFLRPETA